MSVPALQHCSLAEYLALEEASDVKHEYYRGRIQAMAGVSVNHVRPCVGLTCALTAQSTGSSCEIFASQLRVRTSRDGLYCYPDLAVTRGDARFADDAPHTLVNPVVIFEVLSDSTAGYDRGEKFELYRQIESLQEYVLVSPNRPLVEHYARLNDGRWILTLYQGLDREVELPAVGWHFSLERIYRRVEFPPAGVAGATPGEAKE